MDNKFIKQPLQNTAEKPLGTTFFRSLFNRRGFLSIFSVYGPKDTVTIMGEGLTQIQCELKKLAKADKEYLAAAKKGDIGKIKKLLIGNGGSANPVATDSENRTALALAILFHETETAKYLIDSHPFLLTIPDNNGRAPITIAAELGAIAVVEKCLQNNAAAVLSDKEKAELIELAIKNMYPALPPILRAHNICNEATAKAAIASINSALENYK
ncbi:MAG: ankyrin repeat domain-containing protein [Candidatus ainarchaeum sp.]|nr:ankyrin repeat domain-containing protein [Candidatus ainarchaeum sp.]